MTRSWQDLVSGFVPGSAELRLGEEDWQLAAGALRLEAHFRSLPPHGSMRGDVPTWYWASSVTAARALVYSSLYTFAQYPEVELPRELTWSEDPFSSRSWVFYLHSLRPVEQLLGGYADEGEPAFLLRAKELIESWIDWNTTVPPPSVSSPCS